MSAQTGWIDFRALRKELSFARVLQHYGVKLKVKGKQATGFCPLPTHRGQKRSPSFSVQLEKDVFQCFGCSAKGNVLDFAARMEGLDPFRGSDVRTVALKLRDAFGLCGQNGNGSTTRGVTPEVQLKRPQAESPPPNDLPVVVNEPLDFELKNLDVQHPYLSGRGITEDTVTTFGLGYCNRGLFKGRIAIPIHDALGRLVGYAGRVVDDRSVSEDNPKYKLPPARERDGKLFEFRKSLLLYNMHRVPAKVTDLIVVEGFPATWWLTQHGFTNTVAVMGSDCSEEQARLILDRVEFDGRIWFLSDGDEGGTRLAHSLFGHLATYRFVRWLRLRDGEQPTDLNAEELNALLAA